VKAPLSALLLSLLCVQDTTDVAATFASGTEAFRAGRYPEALAAFTAVAAAVGDAAPAELHFDLALAALRAGRPEQAAEAALRAAAGGPVLAPSCDFLLGNAAWLRCERADAAASLTDPEPGAFDTAIAAAVTAGEAWQRAVVARGAWPEAARNVERAQQKRADLERRKLEFEQSRRARKQPGEPQPLPLPVPEPAPGPEQPQPAQPAPQLAPLSPEQVQHLLERLAAKEQEKQVLRRREQQAQRIAVERDW